MVKKNKLSIILNALLIIGILSALFLVYEHFSATASKYCTFGESFDCGIVNKSPYANLDGRSYLLTIDFGLPLPLIDISGINWFFDLMTSNAFWGFLTLLLVFLLHTKFKNKKLLWITPEKNKKWIRGLLIFGLIYGIYLLAIQHFILKTYCIVCLILDAVILFSLIIVIKTKNKPKAKKSGSAKYIIIVIVIIAVIIGVIFLSKSGSKYPRESIDAFAKCLTEKGTLMYGTFWCPKCAEQKKMLDSSFQFIDYIECDARGENEQSQLCIEKNVEKYPDWQFPDGTRLVGILPFEELGAKAGCTPPEKS